MAKVGGKSRSHGTDGKRRVWRKLHIAVDTSTHEIVAAELSLSNVTDAEVLPNLLKQTRRKIIEISGAQGVAMMLYESNERYGYHKRSLSETAMHRVKQLLGGKLSLRNYNAQVGETYSMIKALNKLTGLGMPETQYIV